MPKTQEEGKTETDGKEKQHVNHQNVPKPIFEKTLAELMGGFIERALKDPKTVGQCAQELSMWHDAQPVENRREQILENKKIIERAKQVSEYLFTQYQMIAQKDM